MSISVEVTPNEAVAFIADETDIGWVASASLVNSMTDDQACLIPTGAHITRIKRVGGSFDVTRLTAPCITSVRVCRITGQLTN